jgi:hypothetical protein
MFDWRVDAQDGPSDSLPENDPRPTLSITRKGLNMTIKAKGEQDAGISPNPRGLGVSGGKLGQVESGEVLEIVFDRDVIVESVGIVAGNGTCGGFYQMGQGAPLAIYCVDADNDAKAQQGVISDLGVLPAGQALRLDSSPHHGVEAAGSWRLETLTVRVLASKQP